MIDKINDRFLEAIKCISPQFIHNYNRYKWLVSDSIEKEITSIKDSPFHSMSVLKIDTRFYGYEVIIDNTLIGNEFCLYDTESKLTLTKERIK